MNERIRGLAEQAGMVRGGWANTPEKIMTWRESFDGPRSLEKFAELIVEECANWIDANVGMITPEARADLLKHFRDE